jgi:DNA-binding response OmpR family regulator
MRILTVDDDPIVLDLLQMILKQDGHASVVSARSSASALYVLRQTEDPFDVLLLDIAMPGMDGVALCRVIRKIPGYSSTPIIMLTAKSDGPSIESAFSAGANDYITKPFDVKAISSRIEVARRAMGGGFEADEFDERSPSLIGSAGLNDFTHEDFSALHQHTDLFSLGNYLSTMERNRVDETSVFAAQILTFEELEKKCTRKEMVMLVTEVWNAISSSASSPKLLGAYVGSGTFICITSSDVQASWCAMEAEIEAKLDCSVRLKAKCLRSEVSVTLGRPFRPNASKTKRVKTTFERARLLLDKRLQMDAAAD